MDLPDPVIIVTGAHGHLGRAVCDSLLTLGHPVLGIDLEATAARAESFSGDYLFTPCDLGSLTERERVLADLAERVELVGGVVHLASLVGSDDMEGWTEPFGAHDVGHLARACEIAAGTLLDICQVLEGPIRDGQASIVSVASIYGVQAAPPALYANTTVSYPISYSAAKGALLGMSRQLAAELAPEARVNCVVAGGIARGQDPAFVGRYDERTMLGRMAVESEIVAAIMFLLDSASSYITGTDLPVDGGLTAW